MQVSRRAQILSLTALAVAALTFDAFFAVRHGFFDLNVYYGAINYWADGGNIYDFVRRNSTYGFTYPPFAALTMLPMAVLSWPVTVIISSVATVAVTVWLLWTLLRKPGWFELGVFLCLAAAFEPMRETFLFGQVNMLLVGLVAADLLWLQAKGSRWTGVGIGLATAIKLTPGIFIVYLLVTRRWRAALVSMAVAGGATVLAAAVAPNASREFWTTALWDTDRVGALSFISNQSLQGVLARLDPVHPNKILWILSVLAVLLVWVFRSQRAIAGNDEMLGFALTGLIGVLISPVTWIHHLVWAIPAMVLMWQRGGTKTRVFALIAYVILCSRVVWLFTEDFSGLIGFVLSNAYVWLMLAMLFVTPGLPPHAEPKLRSLDIGSARRVKLPRAVRV